MLCLFHGDMTAALVGGRIFRLEAFAALAAVASVLWWGGVRGYLPALLVLGRAFTAVLLYRYVPVPAIGPGSSMYEPVRFAEKTVSAVAAGAGSLLAAVAVAASVRRGNDGARPEVARAAGANLSKPPH